MMECALRWMLLLICTCSLHPATGQDDDWSWTVDEPGSLGGFPDTEETACDGDTIYLRCPGNDVIQIKSATYGRQNPDTCSAPSDQMKNVDCSLAEAKEIIEKRCNNKTDCDFRVSSETFDDPCPGTHKYLKTSYQCLRFMFGCPGSLIGIGREQPSVVDVQPQEAAWTKDPLYDIDHVFFASSGRTVHEYSSWNNFVRGYSTTQYVLPSNMARRNFVVYDRNLFYIKANSRNIIRYNLITRFRTKETVLPRVTSRSNTHGEDISLSVDESGLWVTYTKSRTGLITISKLDKNTLKITKSWSTTRRVSESLHTFVICGVVYSVSAINGKVDYSFNTNLNANREKKNLDILFNAPGRRTPGNRRSMRYNATFVSYNPRDQLLYSWDASTAIAVYYKLTFDGLDPKKNYATTTSTTTTTTTTQTTRQPATRRSTHAPVISRSSSSADVSSPVVPDVNSCPPTVRGRFSWPKTRAGETARISCDDGTAGHASWQCVRQPSMRQAAWHVAGPVVTQCITWASEIKNKYVTGEIDRASAFESLSSEVSRYEVTTKSLEYVAKLINDLLENKGLPSMEHAKSMVESISKIYDQLLKNDEIWKDLTSKKQSEIAQILLKATEKVGFFYADTVAAVPATVRERDPLIVKGSEVSIKVEVREKSPYHLSSSTMTSFPNEKTCTNKQKCNSDIIKVPDSEIARQNNPSTLVFTLYQSLGNYLAPDADQEWLLDSKVISATFHQPNSFTKLGRKAIVTLQHKDKTVKQRRCVFWDFSESAGKGNWSADGCEIISTNEKNTTCGCDHLSSFAVQMNQMEPPNAKPTFDPMQDIITKVGISIAVVCLLFSVLTLTCFRNLHSDRDTIHKHFCVCLLAAEILFLVGINQTQFAVFCSVVAGLLHFFFLSVFVWMTLESIHLYGELTDVPDRNSNFKIYNYIAAYGAPLVVVGISVGVGHHRYGSDEACWIQMDSGIIWSFLGPIAFLISSNLVFLCMTVCKMYKNSITFSDAGRINATKSAVRGASVLLCLLGITWAFGKLWLSEESSILAYLFSVFNAFQGIFIFIFYCLLPKKVRQEYTRCLGRLPCCQKLGRDYVSNSMSFSKPYTPGRYPNGSNGGSQQASLNRTSHLRRMWNETVVTPKTSQSTPITSEVPPTRDVSRGAPCPHRQGGHHSPPHVNADPRQRQEDDVFLPVEHDKENRSENVRLLHNNQGEVEYDRLQYYRCPEHYNAGPPRSYSPQAHYHPSPQRQLHQPMTMVPHPPHNNSNSNFEPPFHPQPRRNNISPDLDFEPTHPQTNRQDAAHPYYWELDPPLAQHQHMHQSSLEENVSSGKRDSGISMQHLPHNSMIHRLANDMQRCDMHRSRESPISPANTHSSSRQTPPVRALEDEDQHIHHLHSHQRYPQGQKRVGAFSDDEGQGSSFEDQENAKNFNNTKSEMPPPRLTSHTPRGVSPTNRVEKPSVIAPEPRRRTSIPSDSDDPIVTDCSGSSAASSFGRRYRPWPSHENMV